MHGCFILLQEDVVDELKLHIYEWNSQVGEEVKALKYDENVELGVVSLSNAIVDPWAVMIKPVDTVVTERTVAASWCSYNAAIGAQAGRFQPFEQIYEVKARLWFENTWIALPYYNAEEDCCSEEGLASDQKPFIVSACPQNFVCWEF